MKNGTKILRQKHLKQIESQVQGLSRMVDENCYSISIAKEIVSVQAGLQRVMNELLRDHVAHGVENSILSGDRDDQRLKVKELMSLITDMSGVWPQIRLPAVTSLE